MRVEFKRLLMVLLLLLFAEGDTVFGLTVMDLLISYLIDLVELFIKLLMRLVLLLLLLP